MTIHRWAARSDANRAAIVDVFRSHGWSVYDLRRPVDLLIGKNGITILVEIKTRTGKHTPAQLAFLAGWMGGPVATVRDVDSAMVIARM